IQTVINNTISVQFVDAVLELQVTPQITKEGTIFMTIHVENTQIDPAIPRIQGIPALDTQSEDTKVLVDDGQTIRIGGIIVSNQQTTINEVPFVGSIPIVGQLFRHTSISTNSQELLFFITPRILPMSREAEGKIAATKVSEKAGRVRQPSRLSLLHQAMRADRLNAFVVTHLPNIFYLTGFSGSSGIVSVTGNGAIL